MCSIYRLHVATFYDYLSFVVSLFFFYFIIFLIYLLSRKEINNVFSLQSLVCVLSKRHNVYFDCRITSTLMPLHFRIIMNQDVASPLPPSGLRSLLAVCVPLMHSHSLACSCKTSRDLSKFLFF